MLSSGAAVVPVVFSSSVTHGCLDWRLVSTELYSISPPLSSCAVFVVSLHRKCQSLTVIMPRHADYRGFNHVAGHVLMVLSQSAMSNVLRPRGGNDRCFGNCLRRVVLSYYVTQYLSSARPVCNGLWQSIEVELYCRVNEF
eukprot:scaffold1532_cov19-Prasinocladus_malaysianus.AAC.2